MALSRGSPAGEMALFGSRGRFPVPGVPWSAVEGARVFPGPLRVCRRFSSRRDDLGRVLLDASQVVVAYGEGQHLAG